MDGNIKLERQVERCIDGLQADAKKVLNDPGKRRGFALLAVNIPNRFVEQDVKLPYTPDEFKVELIKRIKASKELEQPATEQGPGGSRGDWCAAIKKINGDKVEEFEIHSSVPVLNAGRLQ